MNFVFIETSSNVIQSVLNQQELWLRDTATDTEHRGVPQSGERSPPVRGEGYPSQGSQTYAFMPSYLLLCKVLIPILKPGNQGSEEVCSITRAHSRMTGLESQLRSASCPSPKLPRAT